jgi:3-oxoacyl-[acyl-carrier protein] reductase
VSEQLFPEGAVLVVGGSGGIGRSVCLEFARAGTDVAITYHRKKENADAVAEQIRAIGRKATVHQLTIGDQARVDAVVEEAAKAHKRLHTVVVGAGTLATQVKVGGSYVHLGSGGHLRWPEGDVMSVAPKAAIEALITGVAREEGRHNIRANTVLLGVIEAGMFLELTKQGVFDDNWVREVHKSLSLKRWGKPEEIGYACVFLASNRALYVTGQRIAVAGGYGI